jgi:hypothetical protein
MSKRLVVFFPPNKDRKTCNMILKDINDSEDDGDILDEDIPLVPAKAMDHRGQSLYYYAKQEGLDYTDIELDSKTYRPTEVLRGYQYMSNPKHVLESINERLNHDYAQK